MTGYITERGWTILFDPGEKNKVRSKIPNPQEE